MVRALLLSVREEEVEDDDREMQIMSKDRALSLGSKINSPEWYVTDASTWVYRPFRRFQP